MKKRLSRQKGWITLCFFVLSFLVASPAWARLEKVGYVDVAKVFDGY